MEFIKSKDNNKIKNCIKLKNRKYRDECSQYLIEGEKLAEYALDSKIKLSSVFITQKFYDRNLDLINTINCDIYIVTEDIMKKISDMKTPPGIVAVAEKNNKFDLVKKKYVVLDNLQDTGNIGTIIRTAAAFNVGVIVSRSSADLYSLKTIRASMGASLDRNIIISDNLADELQNMKNSGFTVYGGILDETSENMENVKFSDKCAVVVGNEGKGISEEIQQICDKKVIIKMHNNIQSLNAAVSAGIFIYNITKGEN